MKRLFTFFVLLITATVALHAVNYRTLYSAPGKLATMAWSPDGKSIAFGGDPYLVVWDPVADVGIDSLWVNSMTSLGWSPDSRKLVCAINHYIYLWEPKNSYEVLAYVDEFVRSVAWSPDGTRIASASGGGYAKSFRIWDVATNITTAVWDTAFQGTGCANSYVRWMPGGNTIFAAGGCGQAAIYDTTGKFLRPIGQHFEGMAIGTTPTSLSFSPNGDRFAVGYYAEMFTIHNSSSLDIIRRPEHEDLDKSYVAWHPSANIIATGGRSGKIMLWDAETGDLINAFMAHPQGVTGLEWNPDGSALTSIGIDSTDHSSVKLWSDVTTGVELPVHHAELKVFPNPASEHVSITCPSDVHGPVRIVLADMFGSAVYSTEQMIAGHEEAIHINCSLLAQGSYTVLLHTRDNIYRSRIQVVR